MNAMNAVRLVTVTVWTFTAVCQAADDECNVSCDDVSGSVGKEVILRCKVSQQCTECCIKKFKFQSLENHKDSTICIEEVSVKSCHQKEIFTCRYTLTTAMTEQLRFFLQTACGTKTTILHVNITESIKPEILTEDITPEKTESIKPEILTEDIPPEKTGRVWDPSEPSEQEKTKSRGFEIAVIAAVVSSLIIIIVLTIYKITQKHAKTIRAHLVSRHDGDNLSENVL